jgi:single-strand DNA-binding protein
VAVRSLNKAQLIGNLTRDPELRYTPQGTAVCTFGLATNRQWTTDTGEKREEADFHRVVAWNKLAELCAQLLTKGRKVYIEGRLQTRNWTAQDGTQRQTTEIVCSDMILLDSRRPLSEEQMGSPPGEVTVSEAMVPPLPDSSEAKGAKGAKKTSAKEKSEDEKAEESQSEGENGDIPF